MASNELPIFVRCYWKRGGWTWNAWAEADMGTAYGANIQTSRMVLLSNNITDNLVWQ
jgi:hypothetical protein